MKIKNNYYNNFCVLTDTLTRDHHKVHRGRQTTKKWRTPKFQQNSHFSETAATYYWDNEIRKKIEKRFRKNNLDYYVERSGVKITLKPDFLFYSANGHLLLKGYETINNDVNEWERLKERVSLTKNWNFSTKYGIIYTIAGEKIQFFICEQTTPTDRQLIPLPAPYDKPCRLFPSGNNNNDENNDIFRNMIKNICQILILEAKFCSLESEILRTPEIRYFDNEANWVVKIDYSLGDNTVGKYIRYIYLF